MSNYLANGVIPIFSDALLPFVKLAHQHPFLYVVNDDNAPSVVEQAINATYEPQQVLQAYQHIFDTYYNREKYVKSIESRLKQFFATCCE